MSARILIVEDNPTNLALMAYLLRAYGHEVLMASDGGEALERVRAEHPHLVLMDLHMPRMDGYEAARALKADPSFGRVPIVAVTALAMVGDRDRVLSSGFDGYLAKPITPETFVKQIEAFLDPALRSNGVPVPLSAQEPVARTRARILVVDNTPTNLQLVESSLRPFGYEVITAGTVNEGLQLARESRPNLILSDLHMPGQDGCDFARLVKADAVLRKIPFVFMSATCPSDVDMERVRALGAARFIVRPIALDAFITDIDACLGEARLSQRRP